jgi:hypothetical protein
MIRGLGIYRAVLGSRYSVIYPTTLAEDPEQPVEICKCLAGGIDILRKFTSRLRGGYVKGAKPGCCARAGLQFELN